ncbi:LysR family transcriptional regulator [Vibrio cionasavignyae]|uniref:LysR family transcriptional regulator n=1 Tax=Vibrio cionasavignyae TaxID=2910252 RepID=UPI003D0B0F7F
MVATSGHSLEQLNAFVAVCDAQSYSGAGRALGKDRTTVRELVKAYEDILGYGLFQTQGRSVIPTVQALALLPQVRLVLRQNEKLFQFSHAVFDYPTTNINIVYDNDLPHELVRNIEVRALQRYPELRINWYARGRDSSLEGIVSGEIDFAILPARGGVRPGAPVNYKHLGHVRYGIYVGARSPLASIKEFTLEDAQLEIQYVSEHSLQTKGLITTFSSHCRTVSSNSLLMSMLETGGWALLPIHIASKLSNQASLIQLSSPLLTSDIKIPFSLFYQVGAEANPILANMLTWFDDAVTQDIY